MKPVFPPDTGCKVTVHVLRVVPRRLCSSVDRLSPPGLLSNATPGRSLRLECRAALWGDELRAGLPRKAASPVLCPPDHAEHLPCTTVLSLET